MLIVENSHFEPGKLWIRGAEGAQPRALMTMVVIYSAVYWWSTKMGLAERAQALAEFHTMVRRDEIPKREDEIKKRVTSDNLQDGLSAKDEAANPHKFRTADLLPPVIWDDR